jgi:hypothetical protein
MHLRRAEIFNSEFTNELEYSAQESLEEVLVNMPSLKKIGIENFVDFFSVRTRVPNFGGPEQARSDAYIVNYMPMVQPSFLKAIFRIDTKLRVKGRLYRSIIQEKRPELKRFPLVKSGLTYPFYLNTSSAWIFCKIKSKISKRYIDSTPDSFLTLLKDYVLDLALSSDVRKYEYYDYKQIIYNVEHYYKGHKNLRSYVDWWLTYELWRKSLIKLS